MTIKQFQKTILRWYRHNRRDMPWRRTRDPHKILVSEVMLQQTQVSRVLPKYKEFLRAFPNVKALATAPQAELLRVWAGLGYWRRAKYLQACAQAVVKEYGGKFPEEIVKLEQLPGIGPYTARALACFAFDSAEPLIDTNIRRVYLHFFFPNKKKVLDTAIAKIARAAVWRKNPREWHYALFDYGATVLKDKSINQRSRHYYKQSKFEGSFRSYRTLIVKYLLAQPGQQASAAAIRQLLRKQLRMNKSVYSPSQVVASLLADGLITQGKQGYSL